MFTARLWTLSTLFFTEEEFGPFELRLVRKTCSLRDFLAFALSGWGGTEA